MYAFILYTCMRICRDFACVLLAQNRKIQAQFVYMCLCAYGSRTWAHLVPENARCCHHEIYVHFFMNAYMQSTRLFSAP